MRLRRIVTVCMYRKLEGEGQEVTFAKKSSDELSCYLKKGSLMEPHFPPFSGDQHKEGNLFPVVLPEERDARWSV